MDGGFGFLKQKYRKSDVDTVQQLVDVVNDSVGFNEAIAFDWEWREWDKFFAEYFKPVRNITKYQKFRVVSALPGHVEVSSSDTLPDSTQKIIKDNVDMSLLTQNTLPPVVQPAGLSHARADYLYKQIRQHCHEENRDITCPAPAQAPTPPVAPTQEWTSSIQQLLSRWEL